MTSYFSFLDRRLRSRKEAKVDPPKQVDTKTPGKGSGAGVQKQKKQKKQVIGSKVAEESPKGTVVK